MLIGYKIKDGVIVRVNLNNSEKYIERQKLREMKTKDSSQTQSMLQRPVQKKDSTNTE